MVYIPNETSYIIFPVLFHAIYENDTVEKMGDLVRSMRYGISVNRRKKKRKKGTIERR